MFKSVVSKLLCAGAMALAVIAFTPQTTFAVGDTPPPAETEAEAETQAQAEAQGPSSLTDDQIYSLGYWQAKDGEYAAALATLRSAANQADPRIQTMIGFSLRKLGRVDEAMEYYHKVLAAHPDRTTTRQYLGEAFLQIGEPGKAKEQLAEIGKRCGVGVRGLPAARRRDRQVREAGGLSRRRLPRHQSGPARRARAGPGSLDSVRRNAIRSAFSCALKPQLAVDVRRQRRPRHEAAGVVPRRPPQASPATRRACRAPCAPARAGPAS